MKEIIAIIRPNKVSATKKALEALGYPGLTAQAVLGRGRQRGIAGELSYPVDPLVQVKAGGGMQFIPKRFLSIVVTDEMAKPTVEAIAKANRTGQVGDGKIFICPIEDVMRVRTDETGDGALR